MSKTRNLPDAGRSLGLHVFLAATIWTLAVTIALVLWRPPAALAARAPARLAAHQRLDLLAGLSVLRHRRVLVHDLGDRIFERGPP